jgi:hypothetical protein
MRFIGFTRAVAATAFTIATFVIGLAGQAQAFTFSNGDLVLAIYGNPTEALYDLGNANTILTNGGAGISNLNVSAGLSAVQNSGTGTVKYTLFQFDGNFSTGGGVIAGTSKTLAQASAGTVNFTNQLNAAGTWSGQLGNSSVQSQFTNLGDAAGGFSISKTGTMSFSSNLNDSAGTDTMKGAWPVAMSGGLNVVLNLIQGDLDAGTTSQVGRALLTSAGFLTVGNPGPSAVPLPAGVVLFGTGLIGLVGIARRSINRQAV